MLILVDLPAGGGIRPKALQLSAMIRLASDRLLKRATPTFWYNRTNDGKGAKFGINEVNFIQKEMETFMFVAEFRYACFTHAYIFY